MWCVVLIFQLFDLLGTGEWLECFLLLFKKNGRKILEEEKYLLEKYFGKTDWTNRISINSERKTGTFKGKVKYVSGATINSLGPVSDDVLVHEFVHVWQYFEKGLCYIPLALYAQTTKEGYDYGGKVALESALHHSDPLASFNWEQQASIVQDHYRGTLGLDFKYGGKYNTAMLAALTRVLKQSGLLVGSK